MLFLKALRKTKVDELPQLFNVIKGDMSLVGPRPDIPGYYDKLTGENRLILQLKPGITGLASLQFANEEEILAQQSNPLAYNDEVLFPKKVELNLHYYKEVSFVFDLNILIKQYFYHSTTNLKSMSSELSKIWLSSPHMGGQEQEFVAKAFEENWIAPLGPNVNGFEEDLQQYLGNDKHIGVLSSGTAAIHLALVQLGVSRGDEVICQSFTFCGSANPVMYQGATPIFCRQRNFNLEYLSQSFRRGYCR